MPSSDPDDLLRRDPRWGKAVDLFNSRAWYEAHDAFEELWQETIGPDRLLLQAIVQIAVAHVHLDRGNERGATILLGEARGRLCRCDQGSLGLNLEQLASCIAARLTALQHGRALADLPLPRLIDL